MMLLLGLDVLNRMRNLRFADGEGTVRFLPRELSTAGVLAQSEYERLLAVAPAVADSLGNYRP